MFQWHLKALLLEFLRGVWWRRGNYFVGNEKKILSSYWLCASCMTLFFPYWSTKRDSFVCNKSCPTLLLFFLFFLSFFCFFILFDTFFLSWLECSLFFKEQLFLLSFLSFLPSLYIVLSYSFFLSFFACFSLVIIFFTNIFLSFFPAISLF